MIPVLFRCNFSYILTIELPVFQGEV